jgi:hypothetical protein
MKTYIVLGTTKHGGKVAVSVELTEDGRLSICGEAWRSPRSSDVYMAGQCVDALGAEIATWYVSRAFYEKLVAIWALWHLNGMRAGCQHQRALGWTICAGYHEQGESCPEPRGKPAACGLFACSSGFCGAKPFRARADTTPGACGCGFAIELRSIVPWSPWSKGRCVNDAVCAPCPICGYEFGTSWEKEELPPDIRAEVEGWLK